MKFQTIWPNFTVKRDLRKKLYFMYHEKNAEISLRQAYNKIHFLSNYGT